MAVTAFVLAGGGTKGAFEVGALEHVVGAAGLVPDLVTSTSAGSILAAVLAQARGPAETAAALVDLRADLLAMTRTDLVFGEQLWLREFDGTPFGDAVRSFLTERTRPPLPRTDALAGGELPSGPRARSHHRGWNHFVRVLAELPAASRARRLLDGHLGSILTLDPLEDALRGRVDVGIRPVVRERVERPGLELRMAVTALAAGDTHYVTGGGQIVGADASTPVAGSGPGTVDVVDGALASSSVPMVFAPRPMGDDVYVDGGCLQNIPLEAAVRLGADRVVAVAAVPLHPPRQERDFTRANFVEVYLRTSSEIGFAHTQLRNLAVPLPAGGSLTVVAPTVDVVGPFEVQQGLMLLDMDYGRLRAEEALADLDPPARERAMAASDRLTVARDLAWHLEEAELAGAPDRERADALARVRGEVADALAERTAVGLPAPRDADRWVSGPEHHAAPATG